jgi:hypothetical protein
MILSHNTVIFLTIQSRDGRDAVATAEEIWQAWEGEALGLGTSLHRVVIESEAVCCCPVGTSDNSPAIDRWGDEPIQTV